MRKAVTARQARQVLARVHGFEPSRMVSGIEGTIAFFAKHQCVQVDPIDVAGRNADLTLQSRVDGYRQEYLVNLLYKERRLFEYYCKMLSIMPIHLYPIFKHQMAAYSVEKRVRTFFKKYRAETKHILKALEKGPVSSRDIVDMGTMKSGWGHNANVSNMILARLWISGRAIIHSREGAVRTYSIPQNVLPKKLLNAEPPNKKEALVEIAKVIVKASRLVTPNGSLEQWYHVGNSKTVREILDRLEKDGEVFEVQLDGSKEKFYAPSSDMKEWGNHQEAEGDYVRFLAPLDPLLWSRKVFSTIYGRSYSWEVYKKPQDRKYGYYTMPVLFNGEYVGLIEPYFRKTDRVLEIRSFHTLGGEFNRHRFLSALREEVERFCGYLSAQRTEVRRSPPWVRDALTRAA